MTVLLEYLDLELLQDLAKKWGGHGPPGPPDSTAYDLRSTIWLHMNAIHTIGIAAYMDGYSYS